MHVLEMEGFLESFPRIGYRVRRITWEEAVEIHEIRAVLDPLAALKAMGNKNHAYLVLLGGHQAIGEGRQRGQAGLLPSL